MDDPNNNQGNGPVNNPSTTPVEDSVNAPQATGASVAPAATVDGGGEQPTPDAAAPAAKCVKCSGDVAGGNCRTCTMPEEQCNCPPVTPAETPA